MKEVWLPGADRSTSVLGFGCASLFGGWEARQSHRLVDLAFEHGYRHFDIAPLYGFGMAEDVLGTALKGRRERITLATKVGLEPPRFGKLLSVARYLSAPIKRTSQGRQLAQKAHHIATPSARFDDQIIEQSLHRSLRSLKTDHLDLLLLHEVRVEDITETLLSILSRFKRTGKILNMGTATSLEQTKLIRQTFGPIFDVWQHEFDVLTQSKTGFPRFTITHRTLHRAFIELRSLFTQNADLARMISDRLDLDVTNPIHLSRLLLGASLVLNPNGIVLVGSRQERRITSNAAVLHDDKWQMSGALFNDLLNSDESRALWRDRAPQRHQNASNEVNA